MESYIEFINKYNNEKQISSSNSSSEESNFDHNLKGGKIKGGFPPVYEINSENDSFREFSPKLSVDNIFKKNEKEPFLNVNEGGGFFDIFKFKKDKSEKESKDELVKSNNLQKKSEQLNDLNSNINQDTSIDLLNDLEVVTINESNKDSEENISEINNSKNLNYDEDFINQSNTDNLDTSVDLPENIELISINDNQSNKSNELSDNNINQFDDKILNINENNKMSDSSITNDILSDDINSYDNINNDNSSKSDSENLNTTINLPQNLEVLSIKSENSENLESIKTNNEDTSIDLPDDLEVLSIDLSKENDVFVESLDNQVKDIDTTIDLPENLEIISNESLNQDGGFFSESSKDEFFDSSIYLPNNVEVITLNRDEILESVDTDSSILDILDIKSSKTESIGNLFMKNFK